MKVKNVEDYIATFSIETQEKLNALRVLILRHAPEANESISYGLVCYKLGRKPLVYFGAFTKHIGFYATPNGHQNFKKQLSGYKQGKGSVQFPKDQPLPYNLIAEIVKFRVREITKSN